MQYGQIIFFLFVVLLIYYAGMIALDLYKARMAQAAEQEGQKEEDIDISDEAKNFQPIKITRDEQKKPDEEKQNEQQEEKQEDNPKNNSEGHSENKTGESSSSNETQSNGETPNADKQEEKPFRRPGYREAIMTDGIEVESLMEQVNQLAEKGTSDLGALICTCENAQ